MSTMIERVAKAIGVADLNACAKSMPNVPMETMAEYVKHAADEGHYEAMARAAIEAMMEPTDAMIMSQGKSKPENAATETQRERAEALNKSVRHLANVTWREMIQAALKESA